MNLSTLRTEARSGYGLDRSAADARFTDAVMTPLVNRAHHWLTGQALPYRGTLTANLTQNTNQFVADTTVIAIDLGTVRANISSVWTALRHRLRDSLIEEFGPLEAVAHGTPLYVTTMAGSADSQARRFELWPGSSASTVSSGLKYDAWVYAADLSGDSDIPELQPAEHYLLLNPIRWQMALIDQANGGDGANVKHWQELAAQDAMTLAELVLQAHPNTPNIAWQARKAKRR